jgi:nitroimidazol reductase NimA-like FMN-containing flavoprotein (pyridoxamine 5'-phosphate oxidase superfamily)
MTTIEPTIKPTGRTTVRRHRERGQYDRDTIHAILDEAIICHLACQVDGTVWMIPTTYGRDGDTLFIHGAAANHVLKAACNGAELTVTVTLVDGLVLARSQFHHSINYRSVVIFGHATEITDSAEKTKALENIVNHMLPGRSRHARGPNDAELRKTRVVKVPITEASAKLRTGGPIDDDEDMDLPVWAGVLPLRIQGSAPQPDGEQAAEPAYLKQARWA